MWGLPRDVTIDMAIFQASLHPDDATRVANELAKAGAENSPDAYQIEFRIAAPMTTRNVGSAFMAGHFRPDGEDGPLELIGMARDITSRKQRESHMHLLMREVTHRSKNLLAIIQAMARQTVKDSLTAEEFEERFSTRLRGLAASHDLLARARLAWRGHRRPRAVAAQFCDRDSCRTGDDVRAAPFPEPEAAQNLGLAFNELTPTQPASAPCRTRRAGSRSPGRSTARIRSLGASTSPGANPAARR